MPGCQKNKTRFVNERTCEVKKQHIINNVQYVNQQYSKCIKIIDSSLTHEDYEKALAAISVCSTLLYLWNQSYTDEYLEKAERIIADKTCIEEIPTLKDLNSVC